MDEGDGINNYDLCKSCYIVDERVGSVWQNLITLVLYKHPNEKADFYQNFFNDSLNFVKDLNQVNYEKVLNKYSLIY